MKVNRQLSFLSIAFIILCIFLYAVSDILLPFVLGIVVAYLLDPVVDRLEAKRIHRGIASAAIVVLFFSIIVAVCFFTIPLVLEQMQGLIDKVPQYIKDFNTVVLPSIQEKIHRVSPALAEQLRSTAREIPANLTSTLALSVNGIFHSGLWLLNILSLILITPIVSFYLLRDWDISLARIHSLLPQNYAPVIRQQMHKIDQTISAFLRGQLTICLLLGFFYAIGLSIAGLNFGFIIGLATGILTFIPYVGLLLGALTGMVVAYFQYGDDLNSLLIIGGIFTIGQIIEGNFVTPKIMGSRIGVHPAWLIFSMLAGGSLLGFLGVIISVPLTAVIAVLLRFAIEQYENSSYYLRNRVPANGQPIVPPDTLIETRPRRKPKPRKLIKRKKAKAK